MSKTTPRSLGVSAGQLCLPFFSGMNRFGCDEFMIETKRRSIELSLRQLEGQ